MGPQPAVPVAGLDPWAFQPTDWFRGHPRLRKRVCRPPRRRGWPGRARPRGSGVVSEPLETTDLSEPDSRGTSAGDDDIFSRRSATSARIAAAFAANASEPRSSEVVSTVIDGGTHPLGGA